MYELLLMSKTTKLKGKALKNPPFFSILGVSVTGGGSELSKKYIFFIIAFSNNPHPLPQSPFNQPRNYMCHEVIKVNNNNNNISLPPNL